MIKNQVLKFPKTRKRSFFLTIVLEKIFSLMNLSFITINFISNSKFKLKKKIIYFKWKTIVFAKTALKKRYFKQTIVTFFVSCVVFKTKWSLFLKAKTIHPNLRRLRRPNLTIGKLTLGKLHIWEVATRKIVTWEVALGKFVFEKVTI